MSDSIMAEITITVNPRIFYEILRTGAFTGGQEEATALLHYLADNPAEVKGYSVDDMEYEFEIKSVDEFVEFINDMYAGKEGASATTIDEAIAVAKSKGHGHVSVYGDMVVMG